jgi:hypothetical protein
MTTLQFTGTDLRGLIDVLIQAVKLSGDKLPVIEVNGKPYELLKAAALLPDGDLLPHHQEIIDSMFQKRQRGYHRTGYNLAHRAHENFHDAQRRKSLKSPEHQRTQRQSLHRMLEPQPFQNRGLSDRTVKALLDCGIDAPERLLFMTTAQLAEIPGVGKVSFDEIMQYRSRFVSASEGQ